MATILLIIKYSSVNLYIYLYYNKSFFKIIIKTNIGCFSSFKTGRVHYGQSYQVQYMVFPNQNQNQNKPKPQIQKPVIKLPDIKLF